MEYGAHAIQDMSFSAAQGRKPQCRKRQLERSQVAASQLQVMQQVQGTSPLCRVQIRQVTRLQVLYVRQLSANLV